MESVTKAVTLGKVYEDHDTLSDAEHTLKYFIRRVKEEKYKIFEEIEHNLFSSVLNDEEINQ